MITSLIASLRLAMNLLPPCPNETRVSCASANSPTSSARVVPRSAPLQDDHKHVDKTLWTIPATILNDNATGLADMDMQTLQTCIEPILQGLQALDAERLLELKVSEHGAVVRDKYVPWKLEFG